jgi:hypothetical protein
VGQGDRAVGREGASKKDVHTKMFEGSCRSRGLTWSELCFSQRSLVVCTRRIGEEAIDRATEGKVQ